MEPRHQEFILTKIKPWHIVLDEFAPLTDPQKFVLKWKNNLISLLKFGNI